MKVSPENLIKVTLMAVVGIAIVRMAADKLGLSGVRALV